MFLRVMCWKEWREHWMQAGILTGLGLLILLGVYPKVMPEMGSDPPVLLSAVIFAGACGFVTGAIMLANERETHTQTFLDSLPRRRLVIWGAKVLVGVAITLVQAVVLTSAGLAVMPTVPRDIGHPSVLYMMSILASFFGLGCGFCGSSLTRTVLAAIGWAIIVLFAALLVGIVMAGATAYLGSAVLNLSRREAISFQLVGIMLTIPLPLATSGLIFSRVDRQRQFLLRVNLRPRFSLAGRGLGLISSLWLSLRQGWGLTLGLAVAAVLAGPLVVIDPVVAWPVATLLIGLIMGVATLGDEQFYGSFRFLADQRLPLGRFWLFKVGLRVLFTIGVVAVLVASVVVSTAVVREIDHQRRPFDWQFGDSALTLRHAGFWNFFAGWVIYGFAFGHLAALLARKTFIALAVALAATGTVLLAWLPSLLSGGLPSWLFLALPAFVVGVARLIVWAWATERLLSRRVLAGLVLAGAAGLAIIPLGMIYRIREAPDVGPPFDAKAFADAYPTRDLNKVRSTLVLAEDRFAHAFDPQAASINVPLAKDQVAVASNIAGQRQGYDRVAMTLIHGWPKNDTDEARMLKALGEDWVGPILEAAQLPPQALDDPRDESLFQMPFSERFRRLGPWIAFRALGLQAQGRHNDALDLLIAELIVARHFQTRTAWRTYAIGLSLESTALTAIQRWCERDGVPPELLAKALKELQQHESARPPYVDCVKAEYIRMREYLTTPGDRYPTIPVVSNEDWKGAVVRTAVLMPWERARRERILNAYFDLYLSTADVKYPGQLNRIRAIQTEDYQPFDSWMPITSEDQREQKRRVAELVRNDLILRYLVHTVLDRDVRRDLPLCQLRATELELALLLYQHRHQRPAVSLRELVPDFLPAVPVDPFSGSPFNYRLAAEEEWLPWEENVRLDRAGDWGVANIASNLGGRYRPVTATDHGFTYRRVRPGHGVVWSIGPDGIDSGGKQQLRLADINVRGMSRMITNEDFLFIVPRIVK